MIDLLSALYDRYPKSVLLVSSYDATLTYANPAACRERKTDSLTEGQGYDDLLKHWGQVRADTPIGRCLESLDVEANRSPHNDDWWIASAVPCADPVTPEIFGSAHAADDLEQAKAEHLVLAERTAIALEYARSRRLLEAAAGAVADANRRLDWVGFLLVRTGSRPINPHDRPAVPLHPVDD